MGFEAGSPFYSTTAATLSGAITSADTTISVNSTAGYASYGRIMIDREMIDYTGITANSFTGVLRGRDGTTAASHASGTRVGQDQCTVSSTGGVPDLTTSNGRRQVREGIQIQEGWAAGQVTGTTEDMNAVYCISATDCWAVGANGEIVQGDGTNWSVVNILPQVRICRACIVHLQLIVGQWAQMVKSSNGMGRHGALLHLQLVKI